MAGKPRKRDRLGLDPHPVANDPDHPDHRPPRHYSWAPFEAGHTLSLRHGAHSERVIGTLADQLAAWIVTEHPDLGVRRYALAVSAWARAEARSAILEFELDRMIADGVGGEDRERLAREARAEARRAAEERRNLGLDPTSHVRLEQARADAVASAVDLDKLRARGRQVLDARGTT